VRSTTTKTIARVVALLLLAVLAPAANAGLIMVSAAGQFISPAGPPPGPLAGLTWSLTFTMDNSSPNLSPDPSQGNYLDLLSNIVLRIGASNLPAAAPLPGSGNDAFVNNNQAIPPQFGGGFQNGITFESFYFDASSLNIAGFGPLGFQFSSMNTTPAPLPTGTVALPSNAAALRALFNTSAPLLVILQQSDLFDFPVAFGATREWNVRDVPEPPTLILLGLGLAAIFIGRRWRLGAVVADLR
jgi:PEP-CTERM motif